MIFQYFTTGRAFAFRNGFGSDPKALGLLRQSTARDDPFLALLGKLLLVDVSALPKTQKGQEYLKFAAQQAEPLALYILPEHDFSGTPLSTNVPNPLDSLRDAHPDATAGIITGGEAIERLLAAVEVTNWSHDQQGEAEFWHPGTTRKWRLSSKRRRPRPAAS